MQGKPKKNASESKRRDMQIQKDKAKREVAQSKKNYSRKAQEKKSY